MTQSLPIVDVSALLSGGDGASAARAIGEACRDMGFFYATGHGVSRETLA